MKRICLVVVLLATASFAFERLQGPTELLLWDKDGAYDGYTLFGVGSRTYLLDMAGRVVHTWPIGTNPHLLDNGHIVDATRDDPSGFQGFKEVDWDGRTVWEYTEKRAGYAPHHDWVRIFNKKLNAPTTLYIANKSVTHDQAISAGADPSKGPYRNGQMDAVVEVDMQGNVVWEWWFFDHLVQDIDASKANYVGSGKRISDHPGRLNINLPGRPVKADWLHCNSVDYSAELGQIVINSVQGELYVIDHDGTLVAGDPRASIAKAASAAGDFLYRFGDPARYAQGDPPRILENWDNATSGHRQMGGSHHASWIPLGLPGSGHLMVFNNGQYLFQRTPQSSILEINPFLDGNGRDSGKYVNPPDAGYRRETYDKDTHNTPRQISNQIVWNYRAANSHNFFSHIGSSAQRLPNGNTFICSDTEGHLFEVTPDGRLVWEYINPITRDGAVKLLGDVLPMTNSVFRAFRYGAGHASLKGRNLTPQGTITERAAQGLDVQPRRSSAGGRGGRLPAPTPAQGGSAAQPSALVLSSPAVKDGILPAEFTGDGGAATPPLEWSGAPAGTKSFAIVMHHVDPQGAVKWYWILYDIPGDIRALPKNVRGIGTLGTNSVNGRTEYAPPNSKGPGPRLYVLTVYALSASLQLGVPPARVNRDVILAAMKDRMLGTAELRVMYARKDGGGTRGVGEPPPGRTSSGGVIGRADGERIESLAIDQRPPQGRGLGQQPPPGGRGGGQGRGDSPTAENKTPTSPNPGQTVGLFIGTPGASPGYTLMAPKHNTVTYLLDNQGRFVHSWKSSYEPGQSAYLLPNGHLLRAGMVRVPGGTGGGEGGRIEEFDWDGSLVWEFDLATREHQLHHDIRPMPNGHVLALMIERKSLEEARAAGFNPDQLEADYLLPDAVVEIEPTPPRGGRIVWEWHAWDHLTRGADPAAHPELVAPNGAGRSIRAFWNHMNSLDYNPKLDQIVLSVRGNSEIWIIDHSTSKTEAAGHTGGRSGKGGDLLYRWGNPAAYGRGTAADRILFQQHDAQWIPEGYPNAGRMTIFNNGYERGWSSIEEIVLPSDAGGRYVGEPGKAYGPKAPAWRYEARNRTDFFSSEISGAQRLPNGNTLICAGVVGHLFEVTPAGETVWQYVNPMVRGGILAQGELPGKDVRGHLFNAVFKVHRYPPDYPGLRGRDLTPKGVIELQASQKGKTGLDKADAPPDEGRGGRGRSRGGLSDEA
jgi:phosphatidylethanolamine-binding protein (PEBP) family uncharacterized protein